MSALRAAPRAAAHTQKRGACERTLRLKVEQRRRGAVARQLQALVAQLVEEGHRASLEGLDARVGRIAQEARDQLDGVRRRAGAEDLVPRVRLDLRDERGGGGGCEGRGVRTPYTPDPESRVRRRERQAPESISLHSRACRGRGSL